jgi:RNA polymerase sigma factor (TIGR02999 family)
VLGIADCERQMTTPVRSSASNSADVQAQAEDFLALVYEQLRHFAAERLARERPGQTLQATALVHEAWLRLEHSPKHPWKDQAHFFAAAAQAMRRILVENARRKARVREAEGGDRLPLLELAVAAPIPDEEVLALDEALKELEANHPVAANLVGLRFFAGLSQAQAAENLGISRSTADRTWTFARSWLYSRVRLPENATGLR